MQRFESKSFLQLDKLQNQIYFLKSFAAYVRRKLKRHNGESSSDYVTKITKVDWLHRDYLLVGIRIDRNGQWPLRREESLKLRGSIM